VAARVVALVAAQVLHGEVRRLPRAGRWLLGLWLAGLIVGLALSVYRADAARPLLEYTVAPTVLLAARRLWRRSWGPGALLVVLIVTFGLYQQRSWLQWWGMSSGSGARWAPLS
jgi:hypothetical protein